MKRILANILNRLGFKNLSLMLYGLKHGRFDLIIDGAFFEKYFYLPPQAIERKAVKKFQKQMGNSKYKKELIRGLDKKSIDTVNQIEYNIKFVQDGRNFCTKREDLGITEYDRKINKYIKEYTSDIYFPISHREQTVFYYKHGIYEIPDIKDQIKGKDIIDCGAFIGDTAMMFSKELGFVKEGGVINHIYCLEPEPNNMNLLQKTIDRNDMKGKIIPVGLGVGSKKETLLMDDNGSGASITNEKDAKSIIKVDRIDNIVKDYGINPGLIKRDIEGLKYDSILGTKEVITKYKPILLISIYHNGRDFYEIKPLIESWNVGYNFKIRHLSTRLYAETLLICY